MILWVVTSTASQAWYLTLSFSKKWVVIDAKVYDVTRFKGLHPGGASVFMDEDIGVYNEWFDFRYQRAQCVAYCFI
jgi:cytochrome b involved in lipid metabolism